MRRFMSRPLSLAIAGLAVALTAFLAFGVFGIHTAFIDDRVDEASPFAAIATPSGSAGDAPLDDAPAEGGAADPTDDATVEELARGRFIDREHSGEGTAIVLTDGDRRVLRFEDDFAIDNGPDLNVFLVAGADADADAGAFDDDFIDLGDLKGNIVGPNYEIPDDVDLDRYDTVVIWCVRFGVAFNAADLL